MANVMTIGSEVKKVKVSEFRGLISRLERLFNVDRHACVGSAERRENIDMMQSAGKALINATCSRATASDLERRERILDRTASHISFYK